MLQCTKEVERSEPKYVWNTEVTAETIRIQSDNVIIAVGFIMRCLEIPGIDSRRYTPSIR